MPILGPQKASSRNRSRRLASGLAHSAAAGIETAEAVSIKGGGKGGARDEG